jgi:hypothetical protein
LIDTGAIIGVATLVAVVVFFWKRFGTGSGHALGNRIASHLGMPRSVFYLLLDNGAKGSSRELLASLEQADLDLDQASVALAPSLSRGLERLEERFGAQEVYEKVKPSVARLMSEFERKQSASAR